MKQLTTHFSSNSRILRSDTPLSNPQIESVAPSIFAEGAHASRSDRYTYIPTGTVLAGLRKEGFEPFMVCQARTRDPGRRDYAKHMIRLRHASQIDGQEANEIVLINAHDGTSSYQMLAGVFRFVCHNGLVCGDVMDDIRVRHQGDLVDQVIEGAHAILAGFGRVDASKDRMRGIILHPDEQAAFAKAALSLRYDGESPVCERQILNPRRMGDVGHNLWSTFNVVQENLVRGGLRGTNPNNKRVTTRAVKGIDTSVRLNQALWILAEKMVKLKQAA